jgi:sugar lactone lactonase YvrE
MESGRMGDATSRLVELVLDARAALGEGPSWDAETRTLIWVDIMAGQVHRFDPAAGTDRSFHVHAAVGAAIPRAGDEGLVLALQGGFARYDERTGRTEMIAEVEAELPWNRMNDAKCDPVGRLWGGTLSLASTPGAGALYRLDPDGTLGRYLDAVTISNGLGWSPDGSTMYYADTATSRIDAFDYDLDTGTPSRRRPFVEVPSEAGFPDGLCVDEEGSVWVAFWEGRSVRCYATDGALQTVVELPVSHVTSCCFGGDELEDLFITTAAWPSYEDVRGDEPLAGGIFRHRPGVRGQPTVPFAG